MQSYLEKAAKAYYEGHPIISDDVFDALAEQYKYSSVGAKAGGGKTALHLYRMYSQQKHYEDQGTSPLANYSNKAASLKLDGAAISLLYVEGKLVQALTRGDGVEGQLITDKMYARKDLVPLTIPELGVYQVTGEIVAPKTQKNSRNYAAGSLNLKDVDEFKTRAISFFAHGVSPFITDSYRKDMLALAKWGFSPVLLNPELDKIYECDGVVHRLDDNSLFAELGYTDKHPRGAYALKERKEAVETVILAVEWQVGRTGKVTPIAVLEPVEIGDAVIRRATLNNPGFIEALAISIGDTVAVVRAGDIIPRILHKVDAWRGYENFHLKH